MTDTNTITNTCEGCGDCRFPGIRWPSATNCDDSHKWVERCDTCELYAGDDEAARMVATVMDLPLRWATPSGSENSSPYVEEWTR